MSESSQGARENLPKISKAHSVITTGQAEMWNRAAKKVGVHFDILAREGQPYITTPQGGKIRQDGTITKEATYRNIVRKGEVYAEVTSPSYDIHQNFWKAVEEEAKAEKTTKPPQT